MTLAAGARLGRYEILSPPGAGGMGEVYRAHDEKLGRSPCSRGISNATCGRRFTEASFAIEPMSHMSLAEPGVIARYVREALDAPGGAADRDR